MDLNKAMIIGRLTADPEVRTTPQGASVASFGVATNLVWTDQSGQKQEKVEFHNVVVWRKLAEICGQYLKKGSKAYFEGRLQTRNWEGQDGAKKYRTEIIVDNMIMLDRAPSYAQASEGRPSSGGGFQPVAASTPTEEPIINVNDDIQGTEIPTVDSNSAGGEEEIKVENIPF